MPCRNNNGMTIAETVASMSVMIPILIAVAFVLAEVSQAYVIRQGLLHAARQASRSMVSIYDESKRIAIDRSLQDSLVFDKVRVANVVNASAQFDTAQFQLTTTPPSVNVNVHYTGGQNGLSQFPLFDPLNLGSYKMSESATYTLY